MSRGGYNDYPSPTSPAPSVYFTPRTDFSPNFHRPQRNGSGGSAFEFVPPNATTILQGPLTGSPIAWAGPAPPPRPPLPRGEYFERHWAPGYYGQEVQTPIVPGRTATAPERPSRRSSGLAPDAAGNASSSSSAFGSYNTMSQVPDLTGRVTKTQPVPVAIGGFSDVWLGNAYLTSSTKPDQVAIKILRITGLVDEEHLQKKLQRRINRELETWQRLNHPRILPLYGICNDLGWSSGVPALIAPWMPFGDAVVYAKRFPNEPRIPLIKDVAAGLDYMHSLGIIHGDLKGQNILVNKDRRAMIGDFGLSRVIRKTTAEATHDHTTTCAGSIRWMAPELHTESIPDVTMSSDVYSWASTTLQIISGQVPFHHIPSTFAVIQAILKDERSWRPQSTEMSQGLWDLLERCWMKDPRMRCRMRDVVYQLERYPG